MEGETVTLPVQSKVDLGRVIALTWSRVSGESDSSRVTVYMYSAASKGRALRPLLGRASLNIDGSLRIDDAKLSDEGVYIMTKIMAFSGQTEEYVKLVIIGKRHILNLSVSRVISMSHKCHTIILIYIRFCLDILNLSNMTFK